MQASPFIPRCVSALVLLGFFLGFPVRAAEVFVDGKAAEGGAGKATAPCKTINDAIKNATGGTTITIKGGVYRESVAIQKGGDAGAPLLIRAAPGERVEVTGFDALTGWTMDGKLAKLKVKDPVYDLYVDEMRQRMSRFPDKMSPWLKVTGASGGSLQVEKVPEIPPAEVKGLCLAMLIKDFNSDWSVPVASVDAATKTVKLAATKPRLIQSGDTFVYYNAPSFIKFPGDWSCQPTGGGYQITFWPNNPKDLEKTQFRKRSSAIKVAKVHDVTLQGLEVTGGINCGLLVTNATNFKAERCVVYNNALNGTSSPYGIKVVQCENVTVDSCIIFANLRGIAVTQGKDNTVKGCEITLNDNDGVNYTGARIQKDPTIHPTLTHCYMHGHIYLQHADNFQTWGWVNDAQYDHNLSILAGQNMMMEETSGLKAKDSVLFSTGAHQVILGGAHCLNNAFENMTFLWGNLGAFGFYDTTSGVQIFKSVFYGNSVNYDGTDMKSGDNVFWSPKPDANLVTTRGDDKKIKSYKDVAAISGTGLEVNSRKLDPQFKSIPEAQAISNDPSENTPDTLHFKRPGSLIGFAKGDTIELNFDGVARTIQSITDNTITFAPALTAAPFRDITVWGWGKRTDLQIDLSSPLVGGKDQPGAPINVAAYQRGELDGSGKRSIPVLSEEARGALFDPAVYPFPFSIPKPPDAAPAKPAPGASAVLEPE